jgi:hypothetical protein
MARAEVTLRIKDADKDLIADLIDALKENTAVHRAADLTGKVQEHPAPKSKSKGFADG